jgi:hypothetical protein
MNTLGHCSSSSQVVAAGRPCPVRGGGGRRRSQPSFSRRRRPGLRSVTFLKRRRAGRTSRVVRVVVVLRAQSRVALASAVMLPRSCGQLIAWDDGSREEFTSADVTTAVSAGVSAADGGAGAGRPDAGRAGCGVRADGPVDPQLGGPSRPR